MSLISDMSDRLCERASCDASIQRRPGDSDAQFAGRRFCSLACYRAHVHVERPTRTCEVCSETFGPSRRERPAQFVKRAPRFCSQVCNGAAKTAHHAKPVPHCVICRVEIAPVPGDTPSQHARRRRCAEHVGVRTPRTSSSRRIARPQPPRRPRPERTVFGDVAPAQPWRPAGFSASPRMSREAS